MHLHGAADGGRGEALRRQDRDRSRPPRRRRARKRHGARLPRQRAPAARGGSPAAPPTHEVERAGAAERGRRHAEVHRRAVAGGGRAAAAGRRRSAAARRRRRSLRRARAGGRPRTQRAHAPQHLGCAEQRERHEDGGAGARRAAQMDQTGTDRRESRPGAHGAPRVRRAARRAPAARWPRVRPWSAPSPVASSSSAVARCRMWSGTFNDRKLIGERPPSGAVRKNPTIPSSR